MKEVDEIEPLASKGPATKADEIEINSPQSGKEVEEVEVSEIPASSCLDEVSEVKENDPSSQPETIDVPLENSSDQTLFCPTCDQDYAYYAYLNSLNRPSRHYVLGCCCHNCGKEFQHGPY